MADDHGPARWVHEAELSLQPRSTGHVEEQFSFHMWNKRSVARVLALGILLLDMRTLGCLWIRPRVERLVDGALGPRSARIVQAHLGSCGDCETLADSTRRLRALVKASVGSGDDPNWSGFWTGIQSRIQETPARAPRRVPVKDAWWLPIWRPFWGHPRLSLGGALAAGLLAAFSLSGSLTDQALPPGEGSVIVENVSTPDPDKSVMVYSTPDQAVTVIWLLDSATGAGSVDES